MVRIHDTKKKKANELIARLERGSAFSFIEFGAFELDCGFVSNLTPAQRKAIQDSFIKNYRLWLETWNLPVVKELLKDLLK